MRQQHGAHPGPQRRDHARRIPGLAGQAEKAGAARQELPAPTQIGPDFITHCPCRYAKSAGPRCAVHLVFFGRS